MVVIRRDLSQDFDEIKLYAIADFHWADPNSNHKRIMEDIAFIRDTPNVFCVLNGDLMKCAIKSSISDCYGETLSPMQELAKCVEIFESIKDKILCVVPGNHEERHFRTNGIDVTRLMCQQLGIEGRYSPTTALVFLRFGRDAGANNHHRPILYTIYVTHGNGGGRKDGSKIQRLADYATVVDADIYVAGHTHLGAGFKKGFHRPNPANNSVTKGVHLFVNTSASLEYDGGYGDRGGFDPPCLDRPIIYLSGERKEMRATI
jgi:predicted phosphodiesterase